MTLIGRGGGQKGGVEVPERGNASLRDVAERAGVSVGTVSHVLNHPERVSPPLRAKVTAAITELKFVRSGAARQLRQGRSTMVGLVVFDIGNPFYTDAARAIEDTLSAEGLALVISSSDAEPEREARVVHTLIEQQVRGVIITPSEGTPDLLPMLRERGIPVVLLDSPGDVEGFASVGVDDVAGGAMAVRHLLERGHRLIAVITGPMSVRQARDRLRGACRAVTDAGLDPHAVLVPVETEAFTADAGEAAMTRLLERAEVPTATFAANDVMMIGAMRSLRRQGVRIPADMALVGYDDIMVASELITPLTSVRQPMSDLGRTAAELLLDEAAEKRHVVFQPELIVRESSR